MKTSILLFVALVVCLLSNAQFYPDWSEPGIFTDSLTLNSNATLLIVDNQDLYSFFEKRASPDALPQIWYSTSFIAGEEEQLTNNELFTYRNPTAYYDSPGYNSRSFIFYESNETGNFELYYVEVFLQDSISNSVQFTYTNEDESMLDFGGEYFYTATWKSGEVIKAATIITSYDSIYLENINTIDSLNCYDPVCSEEYVLYRKIENDSSHIYFSKYDNYSGHWLEPDTVFATGNNTELTKARSMSFGSEPYFCWRNNNGTYGFDPYWNQVDQLSFYGIDNINETSLLIYYLITDMYAPMGIYTFTSGEDNQREVWATISYYSEPKNISENVYCDANPQVFVSYEGSYYFNAMAVWESTVNNNSVLSCSQISISYGKVNENNFRQRNQLNCKISPNPFSESLNIEYYLSSPSEISIDIYSLSGKHITNIKTGIAKKGWNSLSWNLIESKIAELNEGAYFVVIRKGNKQTVQKVIYTK